MHQKAMEDITSFRGSAAMCATAPARNTSLPCGPCADRDGQAAVRAYPWLDRDGDVFILLFLFVGKDKALFGRKTQRRGRKRLDRLA
jgi:hypothetical protein